VRVVHAAVLRHRDHAVDGIAAPAREHPEADAVELGLEVVVREHEVEVAARHHRVRVLHGRAHPQLQGDAADRREVVEDRVPALGGEHRAMLIEDPERQRAVLGAGGADHRTQHQQGHEETSKR
jgi:hypothetical protein